MRHGRNLEVLEAAAGDRKAAGKSQDDRALVEILRALNARRCWEVYPLGDARAYQRTLMRIGEFLVASWW